MTDDSTSNLNPANLIFEPNYTQIPNVIIDYWMNILSPAEFKVLICICRKTLGWQKRRDSISLKQIEKLTGLSRMGISKALIVLFDHQLINKIKSKTMDGDDAANQYELNIISANVNSVGGGSKLSLLGVVNSVDQGVVNSVYPQKKDYTKERLTKEEVSAKAEPPPPPISKKSSKDEEQKQAYRENVHLTPQQFKKLVDELGAEVVEAMLDILSASKGARGVKYKSDYHTMINGGWVRQKYYESKSLPTKPNTHKSSTSTAKEIDVDEIEKRRLHAKNFIHSYWNKFREGFKPIEDNSLQFLRLGGNEKLYYKEPKFYQLFDHYMKKAVS